MHVLAVFLFAPAKSSVKQSDWLACTNNAANAVDCCFYNGSSGVSYTDQSNIQVMTSTCVKQFACNPLQLDYIVLFRTVVQGARGTGNGRWPKVLR